MGARWYNGADAAFRSRDSVFGELATPISLNRYTYAWATPLMYWDPDGRTVEYIPGLDGPALKGNMADTHSHTHVTTSEGNQRRADEIARLVVEERFEAVAGMFDLPAGFTQPASDLVQESIAGWLHRMLNNPWMLEVSYYGQFLGGIGTNHMVGVQESDPRFELFLSLDEAAYFEAGNPIDSIAADLLRAGSSAHVVESFLNAPCKILRCDLSAGEAFMEGQNYVSPFPLSRGESGMQLTNDVMFHVAMGVLYGQMAAVLRTRPGTPGYSSPRAPTVNEGYNLDPRLQAGTGPRETTLHGADRIAGAGATRGGVLNPREISVVRSDGMVYQQANGALARVLKQPDGRYSVVVDGNRGLITTFKNLSQNSLDRLAKNYGWPQP
ncbi:MAG: hypothetical protein GY788_13195 [bacterium]|nr:hypothetical protein [bacterium]